MKKQTQVYGISIRSWPDTSTIDVYRYDPRDEDRDISRYYRQYTTASLRRIERLMQGHPIKTIDRDNPARSSRSVRFNPSPIERREEAL
jgi:hypothetical protein